MQTDGANGTGNRKSIAIEICYSKSGGNRFIEAEKLAAQFTAQLLRERGWGIDRVRTHQSWSGKNCLPTDSTELLTKEGWVSLADVQIGDEVAQWDGGKIEFVKVEDIVEPYTAETIKARGLEATPDHDIVCRTSGKNPSYWTKKKWAQVLDSTFHILPTGGYYDAPGLPISDDYLRFLVWVQADGHYAKRASKYTGELHQLGIEFHFAKKRKADRVDEILNSLEQKHTYAVRSDGTYVIRIHDAKKKEELEEWLDDKQFSWKLLDMDEHQRGVFFDEIILADGSVENNAYFSTKQQNYDVVAALAALDGRRSYQTTTGSSTAIIFSNSNYTVGNKTAMEFRKTTVSCVTVPSECILIRQNGRVVVVGNCPHRTLEMGWGRFLNMINAALNPPAPAVIKWVDNAGSGVIDGTTDLVNIPTGKFLKKLSGTFDYVQTTEDGTWARTDYSRDHNLDNGVRTDSFKKPVRPVIEWVDVPTTTMYIKKQANLINLDTGATVKTLTGDFTFVQKTADNVYVRTSYSRDKNINTAVRFEDLEVIPVPEPEPEPTPGEDPVPDQTIPILQSIISFIQAIIDKLTKKG